jgi:hypothetical protein
MSLRLSVACAAFVFLTTFTARGQEPEQKRSRQAGVAVEWSSVVEGWGGGASFRQWRGGLGLDVGVASWKSESRRDFPGGESAISDFTSQTGFTAGVSVLGRAAAGRFAATAGAGPALFWKRTSTRTTFDGVEGSNTRVRSSTLGLRFLLEVEANVADPVSAFAGGRAELFDLRHGIGTGALLSGVRVRF